MKFSSVKCLMLLAALVASLGFSATVMAQPGGGGGGGNLAGVKVDADGILRNRSVADPSGQLNRQRASQAIATLNQDLAKTSDLRKVSLSRLQAELKRLQDAGQAIPDDLSYLAGLTSITHVFCYPESGDIVVAGPAEGFFTDVNGHVRGVRSGQATVQLQHLLAALRAYPQNGQSQNQIGCSIDPTEEGLVRMQKYVSSVNFVNPAQAAQIAQGVRDSLGMQKIRVMGVAPETHAAHVLVEADYKMKIIGLGLERIQGVTAYIDKIRGGSKNGLVRWFLAPKYDCVKVSQDQLAMTLEGNAVELLTESEIVDQFGNRQALDDKNASLPSLAFCRSFTKNYEKIALADPVFSELSNVMDLAIVAAFIQNKDFYNLSGLKLDFLSDEKQLPINTLPAVRQVESVVTAVFKGNSLITPVSGGVSIEPELALKESFISTDDSGKTDEMRSQITLENLGENQWWWD